MRKRRSGGGSIVAQSVLGTIEPLQAESTRTEESEYRLLLVRVDLRELFVLGPSAVKILLRLEHARNFKPDAGGKFVAAGVSVHLEVVNRGRLLPQVILENGSSFIEIGFFERLRSAEDIRIGRPADLRFDGLAGLLLETGAHDPVSGAHPEQESADMRPVRHRRAGARHRAVKEFHGEPERQKGVSRSFKAMPENKAVEAHFDSHPGEAHEKTTHQRRYRSGSAHERYVTSGRAPRVELQSSGSGNEIKDGVNQSAPVVLENKSRKPEEPHVPDQVQPSPHAGNLR